MSGFRSITAYVPDRVSTMAVGMLAEVFTTDGSPDIPPFRITYCAAEIGSVGTDLGLSFPVEAGLDRLSTGDLVVLLPSSQPDANPSTRLIATVRAAYNGGATIASHSDGSYILAAAGLLDGRRITTHWRLASDFATRYPRVIVAPEHRYIDHGRIVTGAGSGASIDLYLHLLRREFGDRAASAVAHSLMVAADRDNADAPPSTAAPPVVVHDTQLAPVLEWAARNLHRNVPVEELAARSLMSPRTFARRFRDAMGTTPHAWLLNQRLHRAEVLLETTTLSIEQVARHVGYHGSAMLREQFQRRHGLSPRRYRKKFARSRRATAMEQRDSEAWRDSDE